MLPLGFSSHSPCNVTILVTSSSLFQPARPAPAHCQHPSIPCSLQFLQRTRPTDKPPARRSIAATACLQLQSCTDCLYLADLGSPQQSMAVCLPVPAAPDRPCYLTRATFPAGHVPHHTAISFPATMRTTQASSPCPLTQLALPLFQRSNRPLCVVSLIRSSTSLATLALSTCSQPHADVVRLEPHPHAAEGHLQDPRLARSTPAHAKPPRNRSHRRQPARPRLQTHMPNYVSVQLAPSINSASPRASHAQ